MNFAHAPALYTYSQLIPTWKPTWVFFDPNPLTSSHYGISVDVGGPYAIVGAMFQNDTGTSVGNSGRAYIYDLAAGVLKWELYNPNAYGTKQDDWFGESVAIGGNYAAVGARTEDQLNYSGSGVVYIFSVLTGELISTIQDPNVYGTPFNDQFGVNLVITGDVLIVSAGAELGGTVYIFNIVTGALTYTIADPNIYSTTSNDGFGQSAIQTRVLSSDGTYIVVGAADEDSAAGVQTGWAYVFNMQGTLLHSLMNPNLYGIAQNDRYGITTAVHGGKVAIGAYAETSSIGQTGSGAVYVYNAATGALLYSIVNPNAVATSLGDSFGHAIAINGNDLFVSAPGEDPGTINSTGVVYKFDAQTGLLKSTTLDPTVPMVVGDKFGTAIASKGIYMAISVLGTTGAGTTGTNGAVYIYELK